MIPNEFSNDLLQYLQYYLGHPGTKTMIETIKNYYKIEGLRRKISNLRKYCISCQKYSSRAANYGKLTGTLHTQDALQDIATEILGPVSTSLFPGKHSHKKFWILTMIDRCTRWVELAVIYDLRPRSVIRGLEGWIQRNGTPKTILSDQGTQYTSSEFKNYVKANGIKQILCSAYSPTSNSMAERINQTIIFVLKHFKERGIQRPTKLAERRLRLVHHRSLGCPPISLLQDYHPLDLRRSRKPMQLHSAIKNSAIASKQNQDVTNSHRRTQIEFKPGQQVYLKSEETGKLSPNWKSPYLILDLIKEHNVVILEGKRHVIRTNFRKIRPL